MWLVIERTQSGNMALRYKYTLPWITKTCEKAEHGKALHPKRPLDSIANTLHYMIQAFEHSFRILNLIMYQRLKKKVPKSLKPHNYMIQYP